MALAALGQIRGNAQRGKVNKKEGEKGKEKDKEKKNLKNGIEKGEIKGVAANSPGLLASPSRTCSSVQSASECSRQSCRKRAWVRLTRLSSESSATVCSHSFQPLNQPARTPTWSRNIMVLRAGVRGEGCSPPPPQPPVIEPGDGEDFLCDARLGWWVGVGCSFGFARFSSGVVMAMRSKWGWEEWEGRWGKKIKKNLKR